MTRPHISKAKRIVIKIGSALLVDESKHAVREEWLASLAEDIAKLHQKGQEVLIVSSGAIAIGREHLGLTGRKLKMEEKQAAAATGTARLVHAYETALAAYEISTSTVLLTREDTENRRRHLNARNTLNALLRLGSIPIINENDTVATDEIRFGDNDRLAARVAQMVSADCLILLSDVDGLYTKNPHQYPDAELLPSVDKIDDSIEAMAGKALPGYSTGGMVTKLAAAKLATMAGCHMCILRGNIKNPITRLAEQADKDGHPQFATWFLANQSPLTARKKWIAAHVTTQGKLYIDQGAADALKKGKSLLAAGITKIEGVFGLGDLVQIYLEDQLLGLGLTAYDSEDIDRIKGFRSSEIEKILGYCRKEEVIHRDDLVSNQ